ncbi:CsbD family protein [Roseicyclus sp. F158]|uniref:CsbD family protein n=1 Tax=Tropicimonas omnivorans TaxID=3075590 RepID=A0ABU3DFM7_9RHOB|nr:CsbD family protein [Roseicyclus sp. F158]MDT0682526.1 CsbD family protein [Roseicyclus sp. F158]
MNWDQVKGNWKQAKGAVRQQWGDLTDDEVEQAGGDRERMEGLLQERYGKSKEEAKAELDRFAADYNH